MTPPLGRRLWATLLTGVPFGMFKLALGWYLSAYHQPAVGAFLAVWGVLDILVNVLALARPAAISYCVLSNLGRWIDRRERGLLEEAQGYEQVLLAIDTLLAFSIVAGMVWLGLLPRLPPALLICWDASVVANVLGVGLERVYLAVEALPEEPVPA